MRKPALARTFAAFGLMTGSLLALLCCFSYPAVAADPCDCTPSFEGLAPNHCVMPLRMSRIEAVNGFVGKGVRVDVLGTFVRAGVPVCRTLASKVEVLHVVSYYFDSDLSPLVVLAVPHRAARDIIALAEEGGTPSLALVPPEP